ncbi:MAG: YkgJ family cysteine cluster protein [Planctomycetes bacterium]|nr:YkgJ family cysteine cluster protein [Planctomycetota bacterium]
MSATHPLPVLMPNVAGQRWSCHSCGMCCRTLVGHLLDHEGERLEQQGWADKLGVAPVVRVGRGYALNKRPDGACVFLDADNRCRIHTELGEEAKPLACRIFPFSVRPTRDGWQASLRFDCPSVIESKGAPIGQHRPLLQELTAMMGGAQPTGGPVDLTRGVRAEQEELDTVTTRFVRWFKQKKLTMAQRLIGAARVTTTLEAATLKHVRGERFVELLDLLFEALPAESLTSPATATPRARGLLRQLAFAHAEHVTLAELTSGFSRLRRRWQQFRAAGRFRKGHGIVPALPGISGEARFETVEAVAANPDDRARVEDLLWRYLIARLEGRSVFGAGYYGWSVVNGLAALCLSVAAAGWIVRYIAAAEGRTMFGFDDVGLALGIVDRAATRLPALGAVSERARIVYVLRDDGLARLLGDFTLLGES